eukprot:CAMPEP_0178716814 /NCGR_PEP_ID=MMETSP0699-20121125/21533_1 /TAXON_ID=265572 /ORGANISM="Extubocellulus spinifer, Strain CCMP396" /LENGTH=74 /DNA_ID=CAMNT_0020366491 /DNA_START=15 /DNA_END=235 /DNA_ORIENTATION=+
MPSNSLRVIPKPSESFLRCSMALRYCPSESNSYPSTPSLAYTSASSSDMSFHSNWLVRQLRIWTDVDGGRVRKS